MASRKFLLVILFCGVSILAAGQAKSADQPTSMEPVFPKTDFAPKAKKKSKKPGPTYNAKNDFYDRQESKEKDRIKRERKGRNSQYADSEFFGHKRPPRKRDVSKMKYCKVCGIRH